MAAAVCVGRRTFYNPLILRLLIMVISNSRCSKECWVHAILETFINMRKYAHHWLGHETSLRKVVQDRIVSFAHCKSIMPNVHFQ